MAKDYAKSELVRIAADIVEGKIRPLVGACQLRPHVQALKNEINSEFWKLIVGVSSECDGLPLGDERQYWDANVLKTKDRLADAYEAGVGPEIMHAAKELLDQYVTR